MRCDSRFLWLLLAWVMTLCLLPVTTVCEEEIYFQVLPGTGMQEGSGSEIQTEAEPWIQPQWETELQPRVEPRTETEMIPRIEPRTEAEPPARIEPRVEPEPQPRVEPATEAAPTGQPEPVPSTHVERSATPVPDIPAAGESIVPGVTENTSVNDSSAPTDMPVGDAAGRNGTTPSPDVSPAPALPMTYSLSIAPVCGFVEVGATTMVVVSTDAQAEDSRSNGIALQSVTSSDEGIASLEKVADAEPFDPCFGVYKLYGIAPGTAVLTATLSTGETAQAHVAVLSGGERYALEIVFPQLQGQIVFEGDTIAAQAHLSMDASPFMPVGKVVDLSVTGAELSADAVVIADGVAAFTLTAGQSENGSLWCGASLRDHGSVRAFRELRVYPVEHVRDVWERFEWTNVIFTQEMDTANVYYYERESRATNAGLYLTAHSSNPDVIRVSIVGRSDFSQGVVVVQAEALAAGSARITLGTSTGQLITYTWFVYELENENEMDWSV